MPIEHFKVSEEDKNLRLDVYLAQKVADCPSRTFIQKLITAGQVSVNGKVAKSNYKISTDDKIDADVVYEDRADNVKAENIKLNIFYEDDWLLIVHKPVGMLVHPVHGFSNGTLVNGLMYHCKKLSDVNVMSKDDEDKDTPAAVIRPGIVHRLDRETSGLLVVAKDNRTHVALAKQFEKHLVKKRYVALVKGNVEFDEGMIDAPLGRHPSKWDKKAVSYADSAKEAVTYYKVLQRFGHATLVALFPKSGRTHQLRVHMAHLKHSILGDDKYGEGKAFPRMALHAQALGFTHPKLKTWIEFSSKIPPDFLTLRER